MDDKTTGLPDEQPVNRLDLLFIIRAYNREEISLDEWLRLSRAWAEAMLRQRSPTSPQKPIAPD